MKSVERVGPEYEEVVVLRWADSEAEEAVAALTGKFLVFDVVSKKMCVATTCGAGEASAADAGEASAADAGGAATTRAASESTDKSETAATVKVQTAGSASDDGEAATEAADRVVFGYPHGKAQLPRLIWNVGSGPANLLALEDCHLGKHFKQGLMERVNRYTTQRRLHWSTSKSAFSTSKAHLLPELATHWSAEEPGAVAWLPPAALLETFLDVDKCLAFKEEEPACEEEEPALVVDRRAVARLQGPRLVARLQGPRFINLRYDIQGNLIAKPTTRRLLRQGLVDSSGVLDPKQNESIGKFGKVADKPPDKPPKASATPAKGTQVSPLKGRTGAARGLRPVHNSSVGHKVLYNQQFANKPFAILFDGVMDKAAETPSE